MLPDTETKTGSLCPAPSISVVIVNFNSGELLERCLCALEKQTHPSFQTIVVDNGSSDGSVNAVEASHLGTRLIRLKKNVGFAAGNNAGIAAAEDSVWIACLNPDAFPEPDWLSKLMGAVAARGPNAFFGCRMLQAESPDRLDGTADVYHVSGLAWRRDHGMPVAEGVMTTEEIFGPCAAAAVYPRKALLDVGGFDESYFCYFEDVDLAFRLRLVGYRCWYVPDAVVRHVGSAITGQRSDFSVYHGHRNLVWTYFKDMPGPLFWLYLPYHLLLNLISVVAFAVRGQFRVIVRAKWDALKGIGKVLRVRREIQRTRSASAWKLWKVMAKGFTPLWRRN